MSRTLVVIPMLGLALAGGLGIAAAAGAPAASAPAAARPGPGAIARAGRLGPSRRSGAAHRRRAAHPRGPIHRPRRGRTAALTRYSLVHGCYYVRSASGQVLAPMAAPFTMQATALGQYLLYGVHGELLGSDLAPADAPATGTVWQVDGSSGHGFTMTNLAGGRAIPVSFEAASGCAAYPEGGVNATGPAFQGPSPEAKVNGTIDAHTHVTAFEFLGGDFHCGRPWHPFGIPHALPDCAPYETGTNGQVESFLDYGQPAHRHDTRGWPTFNAWPSPTDLAEEGDYYTGIERAWKAGLRVMVTQLVDNEALCQLMSKRRNPCNDMDSVRIQAKDLRALQNYVDAQAGGPGQGFFRIVTNPFQARQAINRGKLAVVEGIEVSDLFNCGEYLGVPKCGPAQIDAGLKEVRGLGVSTFFPIHKFDNAFGGTKMDAGELGVLVNAGNHLETGQFWNIQTCTGPEHDSTQLTTLPTGALATMLNGAAGRTLLPRLPPVKGVPPLPNPLPNPVLPVKNPVPPVKNPLLPVKNPLPPVTNPLPPVTNPLPPVTNPVTSQLPVYPPPPHCNTRGLTSLGTYLIDKMIQQHLIVELDHMDAKTADATLSLLEAHHYSGVVSAHSWDSPQENPRIYNLGGFVTPIAGASPSNFVTQWKASLAVRNQRFYNGTGFGYGADMNGLAEQSQPDSSNPITYPFKSFDGKVTFAREQWGRRVFDLNRDGVANYGMYPDWLSELQQIGGAPLMTDMFHGAEAYLQMWERAYGVPPTSCRPARDRLGSAGLGAIRLGAGPSAVLFATGQPTDRPGRSYRYCVAGQPQASVTAVFSPGGRVVMVTSSSPGVHAGRLHPASPAPRRTARLGLRLGPGLWLGRAMGSGTRFVYRVRAGRVAWVAAVAGSDARSPRRLRADARSAGLT